MAYAGALAIRQIAPGRGLPGNETSFWWLRLAPSERGLELADVLAGLERMPGQHLVLVRYGPTHDPGLQMEWVYNRADIDRARVIWARDMGDSDNSRLLRYYRDRDVWLIEPDRHPVRLLPYLPSRAGEPPALEPRRNGPRPGDSPSRGRVGSTQNVRGGPAQ
jgi:hypothetical protein